MFQLFLEKLRELFLSKVVESFWSKVVDETADNAHNSMKSITESKLSLDNLETNLKLLSAKAADVEVQIKNQERSRQKKRKREVEEWLERVKSTEQEVDELEAQVASEGLIMRLMDGGKAAKLNEQVEKLIEQTRDFGELVIDVCGSSGETLLTNGVIGKAFNENVEAIMELLGAREVSSIGVYGMGGVGKTTLAKHVHNQLLVQQQGCVFWVTVSQEFSIWSLQEKIARFLGVNLSDENEIEIRAKRLHVALSEMKDSVLILDDVWENIDLLEAGCPSSRDCCRVIITTRSLEVCNQILCERVIRVKKLGEDEAWKLFKVTLGNEMKFEPRVEEIARSVAKLCNGLPLGIITVAGSMRGEKDIHTWKNALEELKESVVRQDGVGDNKVFKVLKYSFDRLNRSDESKNTESFNRLQLCFLYCSLYPEDCEIAREYLVRKFISGGLVDDRKSRRAQLEQGHSILDRLSNLCLLEGCVNDNNDECVKMHDLVRGMALKIGEGKCMVRTVNRSLKDMYAPKEGEWTHGLEKVSLMNLGMTRIDPGISPDCPNLSSLLIWSNTLDFIPDSFFSKMQSLCTLDLCGNLCIAMLPDSVGEMTRLEALLLEKCYRLEKVPYLGKLKALRELNLSYTSIKEVPRGVEELSNLKLLSLDAPELKILPQGMLLKLEHLQHLNLPLHIQVNAEEIKNLKELEEFGGGVGHLSDFNSFVEAQVDDPCYKIGVRSKNAPLGFGEQGDLGCHKNELVLCESNLQGLNILGQGIVYLTISECEGLSISFSDDLSRLNNPTSLKGVRISKCGGIECVMKSSDHGLPSSQISKTLKAIDLMFLDDLKVVVQRRDTVAATSPAPAQLVLHSLRCLRINKCDKMSKVGIPVSGVPNLEYIEIEECGEMEEIFEDELGSSGSVTALPRLQMLCLNGLPRLKRVCKATIICNSIIIVSIKRCPRLMKKLPVDMDAPPSPTLKRMEVEREWWESLEWDNNPNLPQLLHPFLQFC